MKNKSDAFYCPSCGAEMKMAPEGLYCAFCDRKELVCADNTELEDFDLAVAEAEAHWEEAAHIVQCKSCGSETAGLDGAPDICAYCAGQALETLDEEYGIRPGYLAPFKQSRDDATARLGNWMKRRFLAPFTFKKERSLGSLNGVYLPYWSFGASSNAAYTGQAGSYYRDTEVNTASAGERTEAKSRSVRKVRWRMVSGNYDKKFSDIIFGDSSHLSPAVVRRIEPFKLNELVKYDAKFINGFAVERYKLGLKGNWERAKAYMGGKLRDDVTSIVKRGSDIVGAVKMCTKYSEVSYKLMLLPLWVFTYSYKNKTYSVYVNGQTGETHGDFPISVLKIGIIALAALAAAALLVWLL
jgi:hypothetical protein